MGRAPPIVEASGLCRRYRLGDKFVNAVQDASLVIEQGEFVAIRGRSGSGKSTLLGLLGLLERPDAGRYRLNGRDILGLSEDRRASIRGCDIGFVFQLPALLPRVPALDNVALPLAYAGVGRAERLRRADAALARVGLGHRREHAPHQLSRASQTRRRDECGLVDKAPPLVPHGRPCRVSPALASAGPGPTCLASRRSPIRSRERRSRARSHGMPPVSGSPAPPRLPLPASLATMRELRPRFCLAAQPC